MKKYVGRWPQGKYDGFYPDVYEILGPIEYGTSWFEDIELKFVGGLAPKVVITLGMLKFNLMNYVYR